MSWIPVAGVGQIKPGDYLQAEVGNYYVLVCNVDGELYAVEDRCSHDDSSLAGGYLAGDNIVCPRHGATFCVRNGAVTAPPAYEGIQSFAVRIHGPNIEVEVPE